MTAPRPRQPQETTSWTLWAPMRSEAAALRRGLAGLAPDHRGTVRRTGVGSRRSRAAASDGGLVGSAPLAVAGICGALSAGLRSGDVVVASEVLTDPLAAGGSTPAVRMPTAPMLAAALRRQGLTVHIGPVVSTDRLVDGTTRTRLAATDALAADVESAWLLGGVAGRPVACVRVVADTVAGGLYRLSTIGQVRVALRTLRTVAPALAEWAAFTRPPAGEVSGQIAVVEDIRFTLPKEVRP